MGDQDYKLEDLNLTELRDVYVDKFHHGISADIPRYNVIAAIQNGEPIDAPDIIESMQTSMVCLIDRFWKRVRSQIPCSGICFGCPDGQVLDCYKDNVRLMNGGELMRTTLNARDATPAQVLTDDKAMEDKSFLLKFCLGKKLITKDGNWMDMDASELLDRVKKASESDDGGESESDKKDKEKKDKDRKKKDKEKKAKKDNEDDEPRFKPVDDVDDKLEPLLAMVGDLQRARDLAKKKAGEYMEAFETLTSDVAAIKKDMKKAISRLELVADAVIKDPSED